MKALATFSSNPLSFVKNWRMQNGSPSEVLSSHFRGHRATERIVQAWITLMVFALLGSPIYLFYAYVIIPRKELKANIMLLSVLLLFTFLFATVLSLATSARRHEILAASAA